jgi:hypothetical protein
LATVGQQKPGATLEVRSVTRTLGFAAVLSALVSAMTTLLVVSVTRPVTAEAQTRQPIVRAGSIFAEQFFLTTPGSNEIRASLSTADGPSRLTLHLTPAKGSVSLGVSEDGRASIVLMANESFLSMSADPELGPSIGAIDGGRYVSIFP